ncbi:MAG: hypothetical protein OEZ01_08650, partial [Candidatus Heimdallarchaeota archaeon]|nr:hypothetical protein [Candidatus Heimdallarchaeota archaeon]
MELSSSWEQIINFYQKLNKPKYIIESIKLFARIFDKPESITELFGLYFTSEKYYDQKWKFHHQFLSSFSKDDFRYWKKRLDNVNDEIRRNSSHEFDVYQKLELSGFNFESIEETTNSSTPDFQLQIDMNHINIEVSSITDGQDIKRMNKFHNLVREIIHWASVDLEGKPTLN